MLVKFNNGGKFNTVDIDRAIVWVKLEKDLNLTVNQAQDKMAEGSTHVITYLIWLAADVKLPYLEWCETLESFEIIEDDPKATDPEALDAS